jgi:signal transduction histidine kinase/ligand-binding sensor domain-containing protein
MARSTALSVIGFVAFLACPNAIALDLDRSLRQFHHTAWTLKDGGPGLVSAIAQTSDGYLWLGTSNGLFRFDGARFERFEPRGDVRLRANNIYSLAAAQDGGLWVGYLMGGASFIHGGRIRNYGDAEGLRAGTVYQFANDLDGHVWAVTSAGPRRLDGERWLELEKDAGYPADAPGVSIAFDNAGTLWVSTRRNVLFRTRGETKLQPLADERLAFAQLAVAPDGRVWASDPVAERGTRPLPKPGASPSWQDKWWPASPKMFVPAWDREGALWFGAAEGLQRWILAPPIDANGPPSEPRVETFGTAQGLSGDFVRSVFEDREGNIWVGTNGGLDRFRPNKLDLVELPGRSSRIVVTAASDGGMWVSSYYEGLFHVSDQSRRVPTGSAQITCMHRDADGILWICDFQGIRRHDGQKTVKVPPPDGALNMGGEVQALATDESGALWVSIPRSGPRVFRVANGTWTPYGGQAALPRQGALALFMDARRRLWFGYPDNTIAFLHEGQVRVFGSSEGVEIGAVTAFAGRNARVWAAGEFGLALLDGARFRMLTVRGDEPLTGISGMIETAAGDLWLNGSNGITHLEAAEIARAVAQPGYRMSHERFDRLDGLPGTPEQLRPLPTAAEAANGELWFALTNGVVKIDPKRIHRNAIAPIVLVQSVRAGGRAYAADTSLMLPVGVTDVQFDYTATSLTIPERVRFRYMLEGFDKGWLDAGTRRQAFYTNLGPGDYRFRVLASNEDGVLNEAGATLSVRVPPAFHQTRWFAAICVVVAAFATGVAYRMRLQQVSRGIYHRLQAQQLERERIARELHDTLLQSTHGLTLRFQAVANRMSADDPVRGMLDEALDRADEVIAEGRDRVLDLRVPANASSELSGSLIAAGEDLAQGRSIAFHTIVEGHVRDLDRHVADEAYRIGREALLNAFRHAGAGTIDVHIVYADDEVRIRVRDDGHGIDEATLAAGLRPGHWGLTGMRERAEKIGAHFEIWSRRGAGTEIELRVPAAVARKKRRLLSRWLSLRGVVRGKG